jgi:aminomethyltransferase
MTDEGALNDFWAVHAPGGDAAIGRVTAGAWSPRLEENIGYAWVPGSLREPGTELEVHSSTGLRTVSVRALPFWDPGKRVPVG